MPFTRRIFLILFCGSFSQLLYSQFDHSVELNMVGLVASEEELPFWMFSNKRGRISENTNFSGWINGKTSYKLSETSFIEAGAGILFQDERDQLQLDELYFGFQNSWLEAVIGRKQKVALYNGLSSSNENILWSLNARPLPGIQLSTSRPIIVLPSIGLGFLASWEEYWLGEERYVKNARLHHKSLQLVLQPSHGFQIKAGLQHFVQWAGNSPVFGKQPSGFDDYLRIVTAQNGGEDAALGDQQNKLGNTLGSYELHLNFHLSNYRFSLFWNHLFEDGTGHRLVNMPDGRYGLFIERLGLAQDHWIDSFIYEFYYTKDQSRHTIGNHKFDNYFNNGVYRSGWTYENRVIGAPFFTVNPDGIGIINNRFIVHHFGVGGMAFGKFPFKLLNSYRKNYGTDKRGLYDETQNILSSFLDVQVLDSFINVNLQMGSDFSSDVAPNYGIGFRIWKKII